MFRKALRFLKRFIYKSIPISRKKYFVFSSNPNKADNSLALYNYLKKNYQDITLRWVLDKTAFKKTHRYPFFFYYFYLFFVSARARCIFATHSYTYFCLKKGQTFFLLWHGTPFKRFAGNLIENTSHNNIYFVAPSHFALQQYLDHYGDYLEATRCLSYRHFRTDCFIDLSSSSSKKEVLNQLGLNTFDKVILGCLTWRRNNRNLSTVFDLLPSENRGFWMAINEFLAKRNWVLVFKPHPMQTIANMNGSEFTNIKFFYDRELSNHNVPFYSLLAVSDALLSDYSSIVFDYCLLQKPIGHILFDLESFTKDVNEGIIYEDPVSYLPGEILYKEDDLLLFFENLNFWVPSDHYKNITKLFNDDDRVVDSACEKFCHKILKL